MTLRHSAMTIRRGFLIRVVCLVLFCSLILYAIHVYRRIYTLSAIKPYSINQYRSVNMMESSSVPEFRGPTLSLTDEASQELMRSEGAPIVSLPDKFVHFDLKGMPPLASAYAEIFPFLRKIGVTGVLMEYEDMFPYSGNLSCIANKKAYSPSEIKIILDLARSNNLQVIPLIQTFGHLEFVLKLENYASLRELYKTPQVICPTNEMTLPLIMEMVDQVMALHPDIQYFHIGSDEVYHVGECPICRDRMDTHKIEKHDLFLVHVKTVASYVKEKCKVQPLMWDDEFRKLDEKIIDAYGIGDLVEIVIWNYKPDIPGLLLPNLWEKYAKIFKSVWVASAFKGANKPNSIFANATLYLANQFSWMDIISDYHTQIKFKGIFLTGWQRYDHFSVLCEILPVAMPSLVSSMLYLNSNGQPSMRKIFAMASAYLECETGLWYCKFPGGLIFSDILNLSMMQLSLNVFKENHLYLGWGQEINLRYRFSNPYHVEPLVRQILNIKVQVDNLELSLTKNMLSMFPEWSVQEWMATYFQSFSNEVTELADRLTKLNMETTFPVRPLNLPALKDTAQVDNNL